MFFLNINNNTRMRKLKNPPATSFRAIGRRLALKVEMVEGLSDSLCELSQNIS